MPLSSAPTSMTGAGLPAQRLSPDPLVAQTVRADAGTAGPRGRAILVESDVEVTGSIAAALRAAGIRTVGAASGADTLAALLLDPRVVAETVDPARDVAVVSLRLGPEAAPAIRRLREAGWRRIVALSPTATPDDVARALAAGATASIVIGDPAANGAVPTGIYDLSPREVEVLRMVADGRSNKWIGARLGLSALTVKSHLARIGRKLGTGDRAHMVVLAMRAGVVR